MSVYGIPITDNFDPIGLLRLWGVVSSSEARRIKSRLAHLQKVISPVFQNGGYSSAIFLNAEKCPVAIYEKEQGGMKVGFRIEIITAEDWPGGSRVSILPIENGYFVPKQTKSRFLSQSYTSMQNRRAYYRKLLEEMERLFSDPNVVLLGDSDGEIIPLPTHQ